MITAIDHFVLTVRSVEETIAFYQRVLGIGHEREPDRPVALRFGEQKINLHQTDRTFEPKASEPTPGAGDFCLVSDQPIEETLDRLEREGVAIEFGPVDRQGARGPMISVYFRDPDGNLIEVGHYPQSTPAPTTA